MTRALKRLFNDQSGATAVEYGLIVAAIAGLVVIVVFLMGNKLNNALQNVSNALP
jgi:pilus assembly protein Flp/PilA